MSRLISFSTLAVIIGVSAFTIDSDPANGTFGPYLQSPGTDSMIVCWRTSVPSTSIVQYSPSASTTVAGSVGGGAVSGYPLTVTLTALVKEHQVALTGLLSNTVYSYTVKSTVGTTTVFEAAGSFRTLPATTGLFKFVHVGETHKEPEAGDFVPLIDSVDPLFILDSSDTVDYGTDVNQYDAMFTIVADTLKKYPLVPAVGNHTYAKPGFPPFLPGSWGKKTFKKLMALPNNEEWYSIRCGNTLFIVINSTWYYEWPSYIFTKQIKWLKEVLQDATDGINDPKFKVVIDHIPPYSSGPLYREFLERYIIRKKFVTVFNQYGVNLVLSAHDKLNEHSYKSGIHYVQTATGEIGNPTQTPNPYKIYLNSTDRAILVGEVYADTMNLKFVKATGEVLHSFTIQ